MGTQHNRTALVCVAVVTTAHGVRGALKLRCFTERPEDAAAYGLVFDKDGAKLFNLSVIGQTRGGILAKADGVDDRDAALALQGVALYVPRTALPELPEDEFYYSDLEGMEAVETSGRAFGKVRRVVNHGAGDAIEVITSNGEVVVLPFDRHTVPQVDLGDRRIVINPPADLAEGGT